MKKVFCIIVTYNAEKWIFDCLSSIVEDKIDLTILIVDNGSQDNTINIIKRNFSKVEIIETGENLGFGRANNLGYIIALKENADYVYLLNQDTKSYPDSIYKMIKIDERLMEKVGVISPIHLNDNGEKLDSLFETCISPKSSPGLISDLIKRNIKDYYNIDFVNAAAWLIKIETINDIGGLFSSAFFHYGEDINFGERLHYFGYSIIITPNIFIHHCREERKGKKTKKFEKSKVSINCLTIMHNINNSYVSNSKRMFKYCLSELSKGNFINFIKISLYPIVNIQSISKHRKSYINKFLIHNTK